MTKTAITNVRVFDGEQLTAPKTILIDGELISDDVTQPDEEIDGNGAVLLPGLIDAHVHLSSKEELQKLCQAGVTTALNMGFLPPPLTDYVRGQPGMTDIRTTGSGATAPGSKLSRAMRMLAPDSLISNAEEAKQFVANRVAQGSDYIKIIAEVPNGPDQSTLNSLVIAAREHGKLTVAHAPSYPATAMAQEAGVDVLTHVPLDKPLRKTDVDRILAEKRICVPTLSMMEAIASKFDKEGPGPKYEPARSSVTAMYRAGVPILAGTDANVQPAAPAQVPHGDSLHHELELLVDAGLSTRDALLAATYLPAKHFGLHDRGCVEVRKRADLVLVEGNPLEHIGATRSVKQVWCGGIRCL